MKNTNKNGSCGRSMVEMLSVLAIVGILSIGGLVWYTLASRHHRANEILYDVRSFVGNIVFRNRTYLPNGAVEIPKEDFVSIQRIPNQMRAYQRTDDLFGIDVYDIDPETCRVTLNKANGAYRMRVSQDGGSSWSEWNGNLSICNNNDDPENHVVMEFLFTADAAKAIASAGSSSSHSYDNAMSTTKGGTGDTTGTAEENTDTSGSYALETGDSSSCLSVNESAACCHNQHPTYAYVDGRCVENGCKECTTWSNEQGKCVPNDNSISDKRKNEECVVCKNGQAVVKPYPTSVASGCYICSNGDWVLNCAPGTSETCCGACGQDWNSAKNACCANGTKYAEKSKACCSIDSGYEILNGECREKCDGHWYAVSEGGQGIAWNCCPSSRWAAEGGYNGSGECCREGRVVSNGHCCNAGKTWNGTRCVTAVVKFGDCVPTPCENKIDGECVPKSPEEVDQTCCKTLYDREYEWYEGACREKCEGHWYAVSEGGQGIAWNCCPNAQWVEQGGPGGTGVCCNGHNQVISKGHCCSSSASEWVDVLGRCARPCDTCEKRNSEGYCDEVFDTQACCVQNRGATYWASSDEMCCDEVAVDGHCCSLYEMDWKNAPYGVRWASKNNKCCPTEQTTDSGYCCLNIMNEDCCKLKGDDYEFIAESGKCEKKCENECQKHDAQGNCVQKSADEVDQTCCETLYKADHEWYDGACVKQCDRCEGRNAQGVCEKVFDTQTCCTENRGATYWASAENDGAGMCCEEDQIVSSGHCCASDSVWVDGFGCKRKCDTCEIRFSDGECKPTYASEECCTYNRGEGYWGYAENTCCTSEAIEGHCCNAYWDPRFEGTGISWAPRSNTCCPTARTTPDGLCCLNVINDECCQFQWGEGYEAVADEDGIMHCVRKCDDECYKLDAEGNCVPKSVDEVDKTCCETLYDREYEWYEGACRERCDSGHWYAVSEGGQGIAWRCCPDAQWAEHGGPNGTGACCSGTTPIVSEGHCCQTGRVWVADFGRCMKPCEPCEKRDDEGECKQMATGEVDQVCCETLYGTSHEWFDGRCMKKCPSHTPPYTMTKGLIAENGVVQERPNEGGYCCLRPEYASVTATAKYALPNGYCCASKDSSEACCEAAFIESMGGKRYYRWYESGNSGYCCMNANSNEGCCHAINGSSFSLYTYVDEDGEDRKACCQSENDSDECCLAIKGDKYEFVGGVCKQKCPADRWIEATQTCCAEGSKAVGNVCCTSDTDSEACCSGMHEGNYVLRTYNKNKFCVPKCSSCQKFTYANPTNAERAAMCMTDETKAQNGQSCCESEGRRWASKEVPGKQCCGAGQYVRDGLCYKEASNGYCRAVGQTTFFDCTDSRVLSGEFCRGPSVPKKYGDHRSGGSTTLVDGSDGLKLLRGKCNEVGATLVKPEEVCGCESSIIGEYLALDDKHNSNICRVHSGDYCPLCGKHRHEENVAGVPTLCRKN